MSCFLPNGVKTVKKRLFLACFPMVSRDVRNGIRDFSRYLVLSLVIQAGDNFFSVNGVKREKFIHVGSCILFKDLFGVDNCLNLFHDTLKKRL